MKKLDLELYEYRKEDLETGEMVPPLNRKMLRWMAVVMIGFLLWIVGDIAIQGGEWSAFLGMGAGAFGAGWCFALSLRRV